VKIVLPVIANPEGDGKFGIDADGVFDEAGQNFFEEDQVSVARWIVTVEGVLD